MREKEIARRTKQPMRKRAEEEVSDGGGITSRVDCVIWIAIDCLELTESLRLYLL